MIADALYAFADARRVRRTLALACPRVSLTLRSMAESLALIEAGRGVARTGRGGRLARLVALARVVFRNGDDRRTV